LGWGGRCFTEVRKELDAREAAIIEVPATDDVITDAFMTITYRHTQSRGPHATMW
jgi:hypothetical protein